MGAVFLMIAGLKVEDGGVARFGCLVDLGELNLREIVTLGPLRVQNPSQIVTLGPLRVQNPGQIVTLGPLRVVN